MPKVQRDEALLERLNMVVKECDGYGRAAKRLGVEKMMVWRFCTNGCAIERTRVRLSEAVKSYERESSRITLNEQLLDFANQDKVTAEDLRVIRHFCQKMIFLVDAYEKMNDEAAQNGTRPQGLSAIPDTTAPERGN